MLRNVGFPSRDFSLSLEPTLETAEKLIFEAKNAYKELNDLWADVARYLGEDLEEYNPFMPSSEAVNYNPNKKMCTHLFSSLDSFIQAFEEAVIQNTERKALERKKSKELEAKSRPRTPTKTRAPKDDTPSSEVSEMFKRFSVLSNTPLKSNVSTPRRPKNDDDAEY